MESSKKKSSTIYDYAHKFTQPVVKNSPSMMNKIKAGQPQAPKTNKRPLPAPRVDSQVNKRPRCSNNQVNGDTRKDTSSLTKKKNVTGFVVPFPKGPLPLSLDELDLSEEEDRIIIEDDCGTSSDSERENSPKPFKEPGAFANSETSQQEQTAPSPLKNPKIKKIKSSWSPPSPSYNDEDLIESTYSSFRNNEVSFAEEINEKSPTRVPPPVIIGVESHAQEVDQHVYQEEQTSSPSPLTDFEVETPIIISVKSLSVNYEKEIEESVKVPSILTTESNESVTLQIPDNDSLTPNLTLFINEDKETTTTLFTYSVISDPISPCAPVYESISPPNTPITNVRTTNLSTKGAPQTSVSVISPPNVESVKTIVTIVDENSDSTKLVIDESNKPREKDHETLTPSGTPPSDLQILEVVTLAESINHDPSNSQENPQSEIRLRGDIFNSTLDEQLVGVLKDIEKHSKTIAGGLGSAFVNLGQALNSESTQEKLKKFKELRFILASSFLLLDQADMKIRAEDLLKYDLPNSLNLRSAQQITMEEMADFFMKILVVTYLLQEPKCSDFESNLSILYYRLVRVLNFYSVSKVVGETEGNFQTIILVVMPRVKKFGIPLRDITRIWDHVRSFQHNLVVDEIAVLLEASQVGYKGFCTLLYSIVKQVVAKVFMEKNLPIPTPPQNETQLYSFEHDMKMIMDITGHVLSTPTPPPTPSPSSTTDSLVPLVLATPGYSIPLMIPPMNRAQPGFPQPRARAIGTSGASTARRSTAQCMPPNTYINPQTVSHHQQQQNNFTQNASSHQQYTNISIQHQQSNYQPNVTLQQQSISPNVTLQQQSIPPNVTLQQQNHFPQNINVAYGGALTQTQQRSILNSSNTQGRPRVASPNQTREQQSSQQQRIYPPQQQNSQNGFINTQTTGYSPQNVNVINQNLQLAALVHQRPQPHPCPPSSCPNPNPTIGQRFQYATSRGPVNVTVPALGPMHPQPTTRRRNAAATQQNPQPPSQVTTAYNYSQAQSQQRQVLPQQQQRQVQAGRVMNMPSLSDMLDGNYNADARLNTPPTTTTHYWTTTTTNPM